MVITYCGDSDFNQSCIIMVNICQVYVIYKDGIVVRGAFVAYVASDQHYLSAAGNGAPAQDATPRTPLCGKTGTQRERVGGRSLARRAKQAGRKRLGLARLRWGWNSRPVGTSQKRNRFGYKKAWWGESSNLLISFRARTCIFHIFWLVLANRCLVLLVKHC